MKKKRKKKKLFNIDEINAYRVAYGNPMQRKDFIKIIVIPFGVCFLFVFLLFFKWWLALIAGIGGVVYTFSFLLPNNEKRNYELKSFRERNKFVNNMTQILTNEDRTVIQAVKTITERAQGEFKQDLIKLQTDLIEGSNQTTQNAFRELEHKYQTDVIFSQYLEQLTTAMLEGRSNIDTLKDIKTYHNMIKDRQSTFFIEKEQRAKDFRFMIRIALIFIGVIIFSFGIRQFIQAFTESLIGWIASTIYLTLLASIYHSFAKRVADDSVLEVKL
ncbi:hypothetical protein [Amphibacillus cookii]|uniref:hypothetical protein n=1 Tax=Amphibacillus cookii TaxID=767787 RepID=UPI00195C52C2|nr:hypothetical protein [Amphibacillus cookii]MBM7541146.1 hypothetical protein [Amphibacillus cookii]